MTIKTGLTNLQKLDVFTSSQFSDLDLAPSVQNPRADALSILNLAKFFKTCMFYFGKKRFDLRCFSMNSNQNFYR